MIRELTFLQCGLAKYCHLSQSLSFYLAISSKFLYFKYSLNPKRHIFVDLLLLLFFGAADENMIPFSSITLLFVIQVLVFSSLFFPLCCRWTHILLVLSLLFGIQVLVFSIFFPWMLCFLILLFYLVLGICIGVCCFYINDPPLLMRCLNFYWLFFQSSLI